MHKLQKLHAEIKLALFSCLCRTFREMPNARNHSFSDIKNWYPWVVFRMLLVGCRRYALPKVS